MLRHRVMPVLPTMLLSVMLVGCGDDGSADSGGTGGERSEVASQVVVTRDNRNLPPGCRPLRIGTLALRFTDALNRGDETVLAESWSGPFNWVSVTAERDVRSAGPLVQPHLRHRHFVARTPDAALDYARDPRGFRMRPTEFVVNGERVTGGVNVYFGGVWREPIADGTRTYGLDGKGFINCGRRPDRQSVRVWSMSVEGKPAHRYRTCRGGGIHPRDLVICWKP